MKAKRHIKGVVVSNRMQKTVKVVQVVRTPHHLYGKFINRKTFYFAHDEQNSSHIGDRVVLAPSKPISKLKRWVLVTNLSRCIS